VSNDDGTEAMRRVRASRTKRRKAAEARLVEQWKDQPAPDCKSIAWFDWTRVQRLLGRQA
jgi:hypothetical protein